MKTCILFLKTTVYQYIVVKHDDRIMAKVNEPRYIFASSLQASRWKKLALICSVGCRLISFAS